MTRPERKTIRLGSCRAEFPAFGGVARAAFVAALMMALAFSTSALHAQAPGAEQPGAGQPGNEPPGDGQAGEAEEGENAQQKGVRLKDLARISGIRTNQLLGYGLVVGLPGTGDSRSELASESMANLLGGLGQDLEQSNLAARNVAAVLVTAEVPPFAKSGDRVSVTVSSIGDARSLQGGVLVQTPLYAGNKQIYAAAQGVVTTGGKGSDDRFSRTGDTVGTVLNGAVMEREVPGRLVEETEDTPPERRVRVSLNRFDFSTLDAVRTRLSEELPDAQVAVDGGSVLVTLPTGADPVAYIARMEQIRIAPDYRARVVINERSGTVVMGGEVRVDPVAVSRGGMELIVTGDVRDARMGILVEGALNENERKPATQAFSGTTVQEIIQGLNAMGASIQDIIAILEALRDSGALHAELVVM